MSRYWRTVWCLLDRPNSTLAGLREGSLWRPFVFMLLTRLLVAACAILLHALVYLISNPDLRDLGFSVAVGELMRVPLTALVVTITLFVALRLVTRAVGLERTRWQTARAVLYISVYELLTISIMPLCWVAFLWSKVEMTGNPSAFIGATFYILLALRYSFCLAGGHLGLSGARRAVVVSSLVLSLLSLPALLTGAVWGFDASAVDADNAVEVFAANFGLVTQVPIAEWNL